MEPPALQRLPSRLVKNRRGGEPSARGLLPRIPLRPISCPLECLEPKTQQRRGEGPSRSSPGPCRLSRAEGPSPVRATAPREAQGPGRTAPSLRFPTCRVGLMTYMSQDRREKSPSSGLNGQIHSGCAQKWAVLGPAPLSPPCQYLAEHYRHGASMCRVTKEGGHGALRPSQVGRALVRGQADMDSRADSII